MWRWNAGFLGPEYLECWFGAGVWVSGPPLPPKRGGTPAEAADVQVRRSASHLVSLLLSSETQLGFSVNKQ